MISENNLSFLSLGLDFFNFNRRCSSKATHLFAYKDDFSYFVRFHSYLNSNIFQ